MTDPHSGAGCDDRLSASDRDRPAEVADELSPGDPAWLAEHLNTYAELLTYLRDR